MDVLQGGDWLGNGAKAFYSEMSQSVLPTMNRLAKALQSAAQVTRQIGGDMKTAEDAAAACFRLLGSGGLAAGLAGTLAGGLAGVGAAAGGAASAPKEARIGDQVIRDVRYDGESHSVTVTVPDALKDWSLQLSY